MSDLIDLGRKTLTMTACFVILGVALGAYCSVGFAEPDSAIDIDPEFSIVPLGENITVTVTTSNVADLFGWQVALKYNGTIAYCLGVWIPEDSIFSDQTKYFQPTALLNEPTEDGFKYILTGVASLSGPVDISSETLFKANFTILDPGQTNLVIATKESPIVFGKTPADKHYSTLLDSEISEIPFTETGSTLIGGESNVRPVAYYSAISDDVDNVTKLVIKGNVPVGVKKYIQGFVDVPLTFNASRSTDLGGGRITNYEWNLGNGEIITSETPILEYVYSKTGVYIVQLTVWDDGDPSLSSEPVSQTLIVGLTLQYFDWSPIIYTLIALFVVVLVGYEIFAYRRKKRLRFKI